MLPQDGRSSAGWTVFETRGRTIDAAYCAEWTAHHQKGRTYMLPETLQVLIDYNYWANARLLDAAARVTVEQFVAPTSITPRNLRDTLLHTLDVEWSWRLRLEGRPAVEWGPDAELRPSDFPTVAVLAERWHVDERAMRAYIASLRADDLRAEIDLGPRDRFPLWYFLVHLLQHSTIQRADAATLLTQYGHSPGDLEFLDFVDSQRLHGASVKR